MFKQVRNWEILAFLYFGGFSQPFSRYEQQIVVSTNTSYKLEDGQFRVLDVNFKNYISSNWQSSLLKYVTGSSKEHCASGDFDSATGGYSTGPLFRSPHPHQTI